MLDKKSLQVIFGGIPQLVTLNRRLLAALQREAKRPGNLFLLFLSHKSNFLKKKISFFFVVDETRIGDAFMATHVTNDMREPYAK